MPRPALLMALVMATGSATLGAGGLYVATRSQAESPTKPAAQIDLPAPGQHGPRVVHFDLLAKLLADDRRASDEAWRRELADPRANCRVETQPHPLLGQPAPDFSLNDHLGRPWHLAEQVARGPVVVVFYLGYSCSACVHHLCELSADVERFRQLGACVVAISADPPEQTRQRFDQYGALGFPVLSDPGHAIARRFETLRPATASRTGEEFEPDQVLHGTFIIDRQGNICWANRGEAPFRSNRALLYDVARLDCNAPPPEPAEASRQ